MDFQLRPTPLPLEAWFESSPEEDGPPVCVNCQMGINESYCFGDDGEGECRTYCEKCAVAVWEELWEDATGYALKECVLTRELVAADQGWNSVNENGVPIGGHNVHHLRHTATNYEDLIRGLSRESSAWWDAALYWAIRERCNHLVCGVGESRVSGGGNISDEAANAGGAQA